MIGVLPIYPHSPSGAACSQDHAYISVKPLAAMLQHINVGMCVYTYVRMYVGMYVCMHVCMHVYMHVAM